VRKVVVALAGLTLLVSACSSTHRSAAPAPSATVSTVAPTTSTTADPTAPAGQFLVASPVVSPLTYSATPGGPSMGTLPTVTWGDPTVRPVAGQSGPWVQLQLDSRPNGSTGWVPRSSVELAATSYEIQISVSKRSLTLFDNGQAVYTSPVGVGAPQWPTPLGTTFVDALVATPKFQQYIYGPTVLVLGTHSNVFTDFDGGDGTVAIHGYPSDPGTTDGVAVTHGCIRASPKTIDAIKVVPIGTPVVIIA
jgi:lipoprotein-anchoring transpeptidase ErfK/SrfK